MKWNLQSGRGSSSRNGAFSLVEVLISTAIAAFTLASVYLGFAQGFAIIESARSNLRATQILTEKMETLRLYTWEQLNTTNFVPTTFISPFYAAQGANASGGLMYHGTVILTNAPISETYHDLLKIVTVQVRWTSGPTVFNREVSSYITQNGLQSYIY